MSSEEHSIQNEIRNELAGKALVFRANVGQAWQGTKVEKLPGRKVVIHGARPFNTGLPPGFSDLFGLVSITITPEMVGQKVAVFLAMEVKDKAKASDKQSNFLKAVNDNGGMAGVVRSIADALGLIYNGPNSIGPKKPKAGDE